MKIHIQTQNIDYAEKELTELLSRCTNALFPDDGSFDRQIVVTVDPALQTHCWTIRGDGETLRIAGGSDSAALCGVYDALRTGGLRFHANGSFCVGRFDFDAFFSQKRDVHPKLRRRGIRQHINFTMDISSYPLSEAKEYIRNLARMRFNAVTFHSYGGQWHSEHPDTGYAGHFFYGVDYPVPTEEPFASRVRNRAVYCIPEAEPLYHDERARGEYAEYWLNEVMKTAKEAFMEITMSVELPTDDPAALGAMLRHICETYPLIDTLELISGENTESSDTITAEEVGARLGQNVLTEDGKLPFTESFGTSLPAGYVSGMEFLFRAKTALDTKAVWSAGLKKVPAMRAGIYITNPAYLKALRPLLRRMLPKDVSRSFLPAHGALTVAENIGKMGAGAEDYSDTMFYSWAEFDGNMYIQQLACEGLYRISEMEGQDGYGVCINHWRTAENALSLSFAAETLISPVKPEAFYKTVAHALGMPGSLSDVLSRAAALDLFCRDRLFNIGFCYLGCWLNPKGIGWISGHTDEDMRYAIHEYEDIAESFRSLLGQTTGETGIAFARLWINRCECSALHLRAMLQLLRVRNDQSRETVEAAFGDAAELALAYVRHYSELLPDRGGEGQLVSYLNTIPVYIEKEKQYYLGAAEAAAEKAFDAPPPPLTEV